MSTYTDRIQPTNSAITTYLDNLLARKYQIPTFQRDIVWDKENVKKLWDSIYKFYPLGSILIWKTSTKLESHREIGGIKLADDFSSNEYQYILDGQQRTTALLTSIYGDKNNIYCKNKFKPALYVDLTIKFTDATDDASYIERFLFWDEIDDSNGQNKLNKAKNKRYEEKLIVKLEDIKNDYGNIERNLHKCGYGDFEHPYRQQLAKCKEVLDNYRMSFIELRGIEVAEVCQIFERINQAGKSLNIFDIVVAKTFRIEDKKNNISGFYLRELINNFRESIASSLYTSVDDWTLLQMLAVVVKLEFPDAGIQNITDIYLNKLKTEHIEAVWSDFKIAVAKTFDFFDNILHIKGGRLIPYRYFYLTITAYFYRNHKPDYSFLNKYFWYYSFHNAELLKDTTQLWQHITFVNQQKANGTYSFNQFDIDKNSLRKSFYSYRGRLSRAILSLYANHKPQDWAKPHRDVLSDVYYQLTDKPNLHHIFPVNFIKQSGIASQIESDSLMNIAYLSQITNLKISDKNPLDYLKEYDEPGLEAVLRSHLIPTIILEWSRADALPEHALSIFIEERVNLLLEALKLKLEGIEFNVFDMGNRTDNISS
ncbi:GmrSD restriction endonuclease domain-containing protein [Nostoc sp.]|uniref:GmrSD restriction endonuclease domain-containing protein n=1 Tax=Nostoc sp. TaxID=1180 RepID=UPI002FFBF5DD